MKKTFVKLNLKSLLPALLVFGSLLFLDIRANAQTLSPQNLDWKTAVEAMPILEDQIVQLDGQLSGLIIGSPAYENVLNHMTFYKLIYSALEDGVAVPDAVYNNIHSVSINKTDDDPQTPVIYTDLLNNAIDLLTN